MTAAVKLRSARGEPEDASSSTLYHLDFHAWTTEQAAALRDGRLAELDVENLAEEIEDLGKAVFSKLRSSYRVILIHMLKWDQQPVRRTRSWTLSIEAHRHDVADILEESPSLRPRREEAVFKAYRRARLKAADETGLRTAEFPTECPYSLDEIVNRPFEWPEE